MPPRQKTGGRTKATLFLVGAFFVAILVAVAVLQVVKRYQEELEARNRPPSTIPVVVAVHDLYTGIPIIAEDVVVRDLVPEVVPEDLVFRSVEEVLGRTPRERILQNEVIRTERLARKDAGIGLNAIITPGKRAMTVETDVASGLAGFLQPGNFVDVIVTLRPDDITGRTSYQTETILQTIRVLAVGSSMGPEEDPSKKKGGRDTSKRATRSSATLELTLEEAEKLALSASRGDIHLVLRSDVDVTEIATNGPISASTIIGWAPLATPAPASTPSTSSRGTSKPSTPETAPASTTVIIQGSRESKVDFNEDGSKIDNGKGGKGR